MRKIPSGARFIIAGNKCINKQLRKHVTSDPNYVTAKYMLITKKNIMLVGPTLLGNTNKLLSFKMY